MLDLADQMFIPSEVYEQSSSLSSRPPDFLDYGLVINLRTLAQGGHDYYFSVEEALAVAELVGE